MPISYKLTIQPVSWGCDYGNNGILLKKTLRRHGVKSMTTLHMYRTVVNKYMYKLVG